VGVGQYDPTRYAFATETGELLDVREQEQVLDRNASDTLELVAGPGVNRVQLVDPISADVLRTIDTNRLALFELAPGGGGLAYVDCQDDAVLVGFAHRSDQTLDASLLTDLPCPQYKTPIVIDEVSERIVFGGFESGSLHLFDYQAGDFVSLEAHADVATLRENTPFEPLYQGAVVDLRISPHGTFMTSVGADDLLYLWDTRTLKVAASHPTRSQNAFDACYCEPGSFAPVAFSADARYYAAPNEDGSMAVYQMCGHQLAATLPQPAGLDSELLYSSEDAPLQAAFTPQNDALIVLYEWGLFSFPLVLP
jgi:WD40 repeat protein